MLNGMSMRTGPQTPILQRSGGMGINMGSSMMSVPSPSLIRLTPIDKKKSRTQPAIHMTPGNKSCITQKPHLYLLLYTQIE